MVARNLGAVNMDPANLSQLNSLQNIASILEAYFYVSQNCTLYCQWKMSAGQRV